MNDLTDVMLSREVKELREDYEKLKLAYEELNAFAFALAERTNTNSLHLNKAVQQINAILNILANKFGVV